MTALTERRKADRATMAAEVAGLARTHGLSAEVTSPGVLGPHGLGLLLMFDGTSNPADTYLLHWHGVEAGHRLAPGAFQHVNPYHGHKATDTAYGFDQLGRVLTRRFAAIADGSAFEQAS
jgi:hypothetical protein